MTDTKPKTSSLPSGGNASRKGSVPLDREPRSFLSFEQFLHFLNLSCRTIDLSRKDLFDALLLECCERGELDWQSPGTLRRVAGCLGAKEGDARRLVQGLVLGGPRGDDAEAARRALRLVDESGLFEWDAATSTFLARAGAPGRPPEARPSPSASDASSDSEPRATRGLDSRRKISITRRELPGVAPQRPCSLERAVKQRLGEVIQEGLLDSVLPYVVPKESAPARGHRRSSCQRTDKPASQGRDDAGSTQHQPDCEVVIYVSDEVKNLKREYKCSQGLLVSKMGYFAEVTTGQKLEDMDISVHCDMDTFDWLMRWIKKDSLPASERPSLDPGNVLPVLVSAAFLQMDPLLAACLRFCHDRMGEVVDSSDTIGGLNDNNVARVARTPTVGPRVPRGPDHVVAVPRGSAALATTPPGALCLCPAVV
ncbi:uncharacterized protein LOC134541393 [Bacillus rossius redtenbacheri]|uniref:uncharacterized protein LOC134541393 n=1 Tax=Bacillus rossius redtenbacheri TaxID=93214 RepID=UPI002FDEA501